MRLKNLINRKKSSVEVEQPSQTEQLTSGSEATYGKNKNNDFSVVSKLAAMKLRSNKSKKNEKDHFEGVDKQSKGRCAVIS